MAGNVSYGSLPFSEQIAFFRRKFSTKTDAWTDVYGSAHDNEFMVAGANRDALLADLRTAVEKSLDGGTLETFRKEVRANLERELENALRARLRNEVGSKLAAT